MARTRFRFAVVGPGRVGRTLGNALARRGHVPVGVIARRFDAAEAALAEFVVAADTVDAGARNGAAGGSGDAQEAPGGMYAVLRADGAPGGVRRATVSEVLAAADLLFVTTPDGAIEPVAEALAAVPARGTSRPSERVAGEAPEGTRGVVRSAFHTSGALPASVLKPLGERGYSIGSLHPVQTVAAADVTGDGLRGVAWGIEGTPEAIRVALRLVDELGGRPLVLRPGAKALYHAGASVAANFLVVLAAFALRLCAAAGIERDDALSALLPLMEGALRNVRRHGIPSALTGPIERGDVATVGAHVEALARLDAGAADLYRRLGLEAIALAEERGSISASRAAELRSLLREGGWTAEA